MKRGQLADYFTGVGVKRLSAVDANPKRSNQHEINPTRKMRQDFLGESRQKFPAIYIWLSEEQDGFREEGWASYYDSRENDPTRSAEWRLYYPTNAVTEAMSEGDILFLARDRSDTLWFIVTPQGSTSEQQLLWLFDIAPVEDSFVSREVKKDEPEMDFAARFILDELGIEFEEPEADKLDNIIERFGFEFPTTAEVSQTARLTLPEISAEDDPDFALLARLDHEEALFRRLERKIVAERLGRGFMNDDGADVDGFISFSLSVQNRRKSRMGHSLENHIAAVLDTYKIQYDHGSITENKHKPDFLFPGSVYYKTAVIGDTRLTMLGAKSTCKDRWRQVLAEAEKIPTKHLLTLEPGISEPQTQQMHASNLQLVVPKGIQETYTPAQQGWLWTFADFIADVKSRSS